MALAAAAALTAATSSTPARASPGLGRVSLNDPYSCAVDAHSVVWVGAYNSVAKLDSNGNILGSFGVTTTSGAACGYVATMAFDTVDPLRLWVACAGANALVQLSPTGLPIVTVTPASAFTAMKLDSVGNVWVATQGNTLAKYSSSGSAVVAPVQACLSGYPLDLAVDSSDNVWVACSGSQILFKYSSGGVRIASGPAPGFPQNLSLIHI